MGHLMGHFMNDTTHITINVDKVIELRLFLWEVLSSSFEAMGYSIVIVIFCSVLLKYFERINGEEC